ncbi:tRNA lysidine(34) synthetase TilS [Aliiroseovarius sp. F47248L]|uniref:tRNA lysidine(34) synthetase TilS n=1 Tax=Aliiroseovarius sp. F47248L TaxID=2926420 RepID=UPI001FF237FC|nr:tRNA lysidine(34) synthetase TilS [Aliiroseovarius sp. F47248L]MCK0138302.1 tRNA lysidine(34) synthetase TilS [Aliiroseovarius sp. F47248L]
MTQALNRVRAGGPVLRLGVAVSGGGDSMALLLLAHDWCAEQGAELLAATVDHGLRTEAAEEARFVQATCAALNLPHRTLNWTEQPAGNVQDAARRARYGLLADWAKDEQLDAVLLGHTADDQAETFLMRLARGSGVDGLSAMRDDWSDRGVQWMRPLLPVTREALREVLTTRGQAWIDDPTNDDPNYDRVKMRRALQDLPQIGLTRARLTATAHRMSQARDALAWLAHDAARRLADVKGGDVQFAMPEFTGLPDETRHRLLAHAINYVSSTAYRPRYNALRALEDEVTAGQTRTLQGCLVSLTADRLVIGRELRAVKTLSCPPGAPWDQRWIMDAPQLSVGSKLHVRALGDGIQLCKTWRATGLSRSTLMTTPSLWAGETLVAAPLAGFGDISLLIRVPDAEEFRSTILSH